MDDIKICLSFRCQQCTHRLSIIGRRYRPRPAGKPGKPDRFLIIFFDKPFTLGDLVKVQNITGNVEKIGLRSTRIRTDQKTYVTVPNNRWWIASSIT
ncbi:MAG: mechanosensitive ion channel domain-containing protein [Bacteroidota bacterium]